MKAFHTAILSILSGLINAQTLSQIESAEYDHNGHRFLVSNQNNLLIVDESGTPVSALDIPVEYGMEVVGNSVFAISGNSVICHDLTSGAELSSITISGAQFLNGMASDGNGKIWVTDFAAKKIHEIDFTDIQNPATNIIVNNTVTTPNGICYDETAQRLVFVSWGNSAPIKAVSLTDYSVTTLLTNSGVGNIDGIDNDSSGNFFIASWTPNRITQYNNDFSVSQTITVTGGLNSPADIAYAEEIDTLIIPNSGNATVRFVGFNPIVAISESTENKSFKIFPNPSSDFLVCEFTQSAASSSRACLTDTKGRLVRELWNGELPGGKNKLVLDIQNCDEGVYLLQISSKSHHIVEEIVIHRP